MVRLVSRGFQEGLPGRSGGSALLGEGVDGNPRALGWQEIPGPGD
jgi:hypothetical protein